MNIQPIKKIIAQATSTAAEPLEVGSTKKKKAQTLDA
jgi:hypothetical protein